jgi:hypothetical protein
MLDLNSDKLTAGADRNMGGHSITNCAAVLDPLGNPLGGTPALILSTDYAFTAQAPGGSLTAATPATVTLTPVPKGVNGADVGHYLYISGGTGTAEAVLITGGTATSGSSSGTVTFTPANSHSGAWTIGSASAGIYEAIKANPFKRVFVPAGHYTMRAPLILAPAASLILYGDGYDPLGASGTLLDFAAITTNIAAIQNINTGASVLNAITLRDLAIAGTSTTSGGDGIYLQGVVRVSLEGVQITGFAGNGVSTSGAFEVRIDRGCAIANNGKWGVYNNNTANLNLIQDSYISWNSRSNGFGNICITSSNVATTPNQAIRVIGNAIESAGMSPFTSVSVAYGMTITGAQSAFVASNYFENNHDQPIFYSGANAGIFEVGNYFGQVASLVSNVVYSTTTTQVVSKANTFSGANAYRTFQGSDMSTYDIGPDVAINGSPEATNHPRMLGVPGSTGAKSAAMGANCPAVTATAPFTWLQMTGPDGTSTVYVPAWK